MDANIADIRALGFVGPLPGTPEEVQALLDDLADYSFFSPRYFRVLCQRVRQLQLREDPSSAFLRPASSGYEWASAEDLGVETDIHELRPLEPDAKKDLLRTIPKLPHHLKIPSFQFDAKAKLFFREDERKQFFTTPEEHRTHLYRLRSVLLGAFNELFFGRPVDASRLVDTLWALTEDSIATSIFEQKAEFAKRSEHYLPKPHELSAPLLSEHEQEATLRDRQYLALVRETFSSRGGRHGSGYGRPNRGGQRPPTHNGANNATRTPGGARGRGRGTHSRVSAPSPAGPAGKKLP